MPNPWPVELHGLKQVLKAFKGENHVIHIGILGANTSRRDSVSNNATVGACHEYGTETLPIRSFLRMPLNDHLQEYLDRAGAFKNDTITEIIKTGTLIPWMEKIAVTAENVVQEAFHTGGFGKWEKWKDPDYKNHTGQILVDTTQLRDSITSRVK